MLNFLRLSQGGAKECTIPRWCSWCCPNARLFRPEENPDRLSSSKLTGAGAGGHFPASFWWTFLVDKVFSQKSFSQTKLCECKYWWLTSQWDSATFTSTVAPSFPPPPATCQGASGWWGTDGGLEGEEVQGVPTSICLWSSSTANNRCRTTTRTTTMG